jgi:hypothetical protein
MKIANVVLRNSFEELTGERRKSTRTFVNVVPLKVSTVATEALFIPLAGEIPLGTYQTVANVLPVEPEMSFFKEAKPMNLKFIKGFEFIQTKFSRLGVIALPAGSVATQDPYEQPEPYGPQVALLPLWGETELPAGANFVDVIECEGHAISAQDNESGQTYRLGYRFQGEGEQVNWVDLALSRRKHWKRAEKQDEAEDSTPAYSSFRFTSDDHQVIDRITAKFGRGEKLFDDSVRFILPSQDAYEKCEAIEREVTQLRQTAVINRDFAAQEALRP